MEIRKNMEDLISSMDKNRIPWKLQNSLFYIGEKYDVRSYYVSDLCNMAYKRAYAWNAIEGPTRRKQKRQVNIAGRAEKSVKSRWRRENMEGV